MDDRDYPLTMNKLLYMKYIGACSLLARMSRYVKCEEDMDCIKRALEDCVQESNGRLELIKCENGWAIEPTKDEQHG